ncbi:MAG: hypothetical protein HFH62_01370 [Lachnospiraceae bacterium]|nr:hypothetical protein [Lachnospiraceae bacterium]
MAGIDSIDGTLYYQWLINNNSTSTMLNAISGTDSLNGVGGLGSLAGLGSAGSIGTPGTSFASILQSYMSGADAADSLAAASMADKLSGILEEAAETEDTSSLSYRTAQELYEYFSNQASVRANSLLGSSGVAESVAGSLLGKGSAGMTEGSQSAGSGSSNGGNNLSGIDALNQQMMGGQEIDFSKIDAAVENAFAESALI